MHDMIKVPEDMLVGSKPSVPRFDKVPHPEGYKRLKLELIASDEYILFTKFGLESIPVTWN